LKSFILRLLTACVSYQAGESLAGAVIPNDMGPASVWGAIDATFNYQLYDSNRIGYVIFMGTLLLLADMIGPKRIHIAWFVLMAAFCGGYNYVMSARSYLNDFDHNIIVYLQSLPETISLIVGGAAVFLVWFFPPVLLAVIKLAGSPRFRGRFAIGGSKS